MSARVVRVIANLDCEVAWAGAPAIGPHVRAKLAALGTIVRAVVPDGSEAEVVLVGSVERARCAEIAGGPGWRISDGAGEAETIVWGAGREKPDRDKGKGKATGSWREMLVEIESTIEVVRRVSDRRWCLALRERVGVALEGARAITHVSEIDAIASAHEAWVAKATITAAGRDRVRRRGPPDDATRVRLARLLARGGALVVEPWLERIADAGISGVVNGSEVRLFAPHALHVDARGGFAGITIGDDGLTGDERAQLARVAGATAAALADDGYRGPFTVDAFAWRDAGGARRFHPLCEVNPRLTFGLVARAWAERLGAARLELGVGEGAPPAGAIALVAPIAIDPTSAWIRDGG